MILINFIVAVLQCWNAVFFWLLVLKGNSWHNLFCPFWRAKKNEKPPSLHKAVASHHSLSQLHACSSFQYERTSIASLIIAECSDSTQRNMLVYRKLRHSKFLVRHSIFNYTHASMLQCCNAAMLQCCNGNAWNRTCLPAGRDSAKLMRELNRSFGKANTSNS